MRASAQPVLYTSAIKTSRMGWLNLWDVIYIYMHTLKADQWKHHDAGFSGQRVRVEGGRKCSRRI